MTDSKDPAYPVQMESIDHGRTRLAWKGGLTKREWFSAMAMQGIIANPEELKDAADEAQEENLIYFEAVARRAVCHADALIAELNKEPKP